MTQDNKITIADSKRIARIVIARRNGGDPRKFNVTDHIDDLLIDVGSGFVLAPGTYIDGIDCQFIGAMAKTIRASAIKKLA